MKANYDLLNGIEAMYKVFDTEDANVYSYSFVDLLKDDNSELTYSLQEHLNEIFSLEVNDFLICDQRCSGKFTIVRMK